MRNFYKDARIIYLNETLFALISSTFGKIYLNKYKRIKIKPPTITLVDFASYWQRLTQGDLSIQAIIPIAYQTQDH